MKSIIIIIPYFGTLPKMFPFWLQSAKNNPSIDFLLITDNRIEPEANIKVLNYSFDQIKDIIQSKFNFEICLKSPYKLCDIRGAYGYIFNEHIKNYDFWGWGDLDLIYGDIRRFITTDILDKYKVISGWGHLTLYKTTDECIQFFKTKVDGFQYFKDVFSRSYNSAFDEYNHKGLSDLWRHLQPDMIWDSRLFDDIRVPRLEFNFHSEFHPEYSNKLIFEYNNKSLFRIYINEKNEIVKEQSLYAHFQQRKFIKINTCDYSHYLIIPNSFIDTEQISIRKITKWTSSKNIQRHIYNINNRVKNRLQIILNSDSK